MLNVCCVLNGLQIQLSSKMRVNDKMRSKMSSAGACWMARHRHTTVSDNHTSRTVSEPEGVRTGQENVSSQFNKHLSDAFARLERRIEDLEAHACKVCQYIHF